MNYDRISTSRRPLVLITWGRLNMQIRFFHCTYRKSYYDNSFMTGHPPDVSPPYECICSSDCIRWSGLRMNNSQSSLTTSTSFVGRIRSHDHITLRDSFNLRDISISCKTRNKNLRQPWSDYWDSSNFFSYRGRNYFQHEDIFSEGKVK